MAYVNFESEDDALRTVEYKVGDREFLIKRKDPYGFWMISLPKGKTPDKLNGNFTALSYAQDACKAYVDGLTNG